MKTAVIMPHIAYARIDFVGQIFKYSEPLKQYLGPVYVQFMQPEQFALFILRPGAECYTAFHKHNKIAERYGKNRQQIVEMSSC